MTGEWLLDCELSHCPRSVCQPPPQWMRECRTCSWALRSSVLECVRNRTSCLRQDKTTLVGHQGPDVQRCTPVWCGCSQLCGDLEMLRVRFLTLCYTPSVFRWDFSPRDVKTNFSRQLRLLLGNISTNGVKYPYLDPSKENIHSKRGQMKKHRRV